MPQAMTVNTAGWATAVRSRRNALAQRLGMGGAAVLIFSPLFGWQNCFVWATLYFLIQAAEFAIFAPVTRGKVESLGRLRTAAGDVIMCLNAVVFGWVAIMLWMTGGAMGGVCATILLAAGAIYAVVNSPRSPRVLIATLTPQLAYLAATPVFMSIEGAQSTYVTAMTISLVIFTAYCLSTWAKMTEVRNAEDRALAVAETRRAEAERAMASRTAFLAMVGHDLRTPISAILTGASELERGATDTAARNQAALITDAGIMMKALLDDLLDHSRLDAGRMTIEDADFNLRNLLAQTFLFWRGAAREKGLAWRVEGARDMPAWLRGDAMRLRQVLNNLISNAMKFTTEGSITLRLKAWTEEPDRHALLIEIADTGPGMTGDQLARLFTAFDQTTEGVSARHGGSGLGLAISRDLTELMGGRLTARSTPGSGAVFTLSLMLKTGTESAPPLARPVNEARGTIARPLGSPTAATAPVAVVPAPAITAPAEAPAVDEIEDEDAPPLRVLVVDDHDINRRAVELILSPLGCDIASAADGLAALKLCETDAYDVIFMDVRMPELDGRETTRRLRAGNGLNASVPVIAVTADTAPEDIAACMAAGMTYFVSKPLTPATLLGALSHVMAEAEAQRDAA